MRTALVQTTNTSTGNSYKPIFQRFGRAFHLRLRDADDLAYVARLDESHWVATSAPIAMMNGDSVFLNLIDSDHDGRIMASELRDAIRWLTKVLRDRRPVSEASRVLQLAAINIDDAEGKRIYDSATKILAHFGDQDSAEVSLDQIRQIKALVETSSVSEGGVVLPAAAGDTNVQQFLQGIVATVGGTAHPTGSTGVDKAHLDQFLSEAKAHLDWHRRGQIPEDQTTTQVMPLGAETPGAFSAFAAIREKVDQFFAQCRGVALQEQMARHFAPSDAELGALDLSDPAVIDQVLAKAPLATPCPKGQLNLEDGLNPHYAAAIARLGAAVIEPILGAAAGVISEAQWEQVKKTMGRYEAWAGAKGGASVAGLGIEKLGASLDENLRQAVEALIAGSSTTAFVLDNIRLTEKLALYQEHLLELANNYVSFPHLYDSESRAMFEMGTLVMDGRRFNLAIRVENRSQHATIAKTSNMFVMYVKASSRNGTAKMELSLPVTTGGQGNLCVGKRGVFIDRDGLMWDAQITQIIDNPISLREAIVAPLKRLGALVTGKIETLTGTAEKQLDSVGRTTIDQVQTSITQAQPAPGQPPQPSPPPQPTGAGRLGGIMIGGSIALAALGSATAYMAKTLEALKNWHTVAFVIGGAILAVVVPTTIVAWLKLRRRDLSAILEGSAWAINARMRLTWSQTRFFTRRPSYPAGAKGVHRRRWMLILLAVSVLAILSGGGYLIEHLRRQREASRLEQEKPPTEAPTDNAAAAGQGEQANVKSVPTDEQGAGNDAQGTEVNAQAAHEAGGVVE